MKIDPQLTWLAGGIVGLLALSSLITSVLKMRAGGTPNAFKFVYRGPVSDASRTRIEQAAASLGVAHVTIW